MEPGDRRRQLDETLRAACGEGLLSDGTFIDRVDRVLTEATVYPRRLVGDFTLGASRGPRATLRRVASEIAMWPARRTMPLLALDWSTAPVDRLLVGRADDSDIVLEDDTVSRRHAELLWRGATWVVHDLHSKNGTLLNGQAVVRAQLRPGDIIQFAERIFRVD